MKMLGCSLGIAACLASGMTAQTPPEARKTVLAVGAHAGDMEITCGAALARYARAGDRVVLLHLTLGEGGNPKQSPQEYGTQKRREAEAAARELGAEALFGPFKDGELPNDDQARRYVAEVVRQVKPALLITHWKNSIHKDHAAAHLVTTDAVLLASLEGVASSLPSHRGIRRVLYAENWEDKDGFQQYLYIDVSEGVPVWEKAVTQYEFIRGGISSYPYLEYYRALFRVRGAEAGLTHAESFEIDPIGKKQVLRTLP